MEFSLAKFIDKLRKVGYIYTNHNNGVKAQVRISAVAYSSETPASAFAVYGFSPAAEQRTAAIAELMIEHQGVALTALGQLGRRWVSIRCAQPQMCNDAFLNEM